LSFTASAASRVPPSVAGSVSCVIGAGADLR
jgi:hypothetical protein